MKKNILILGGTGFIATNIIAHFLDSHFNTNDNITFIIATRNAKSFINTRNNIYVKCDFKTELDIINIFNTFQITEVFHFLNTNVPSTSGHNIINDINSNLNSTIRLLDIMILHKVKKIFFLSSGGTLYNNNLECTNCFQEDSVIAPNNSYGIIKMTIENYIKLYSKNGYIEFLIFRIPNIFGPFHNNVNNGIINIAIKSALENNKIIIWGDGTMRKDYLFSLDLAKIFWDFYFSDIKNEVFNIGTGDLYSTNQILNKIKNYLPNLSWDHTDLSPFDTNLTIFNIDKLKLSFNVKFTTLEDAISQTISWQKVNLF